MPPIFVITGPPAAGKSTLAHALMQLYELGVHIPVDNIRELVVSGIAHPIDWTDETTRQFNLAEQAAADIACRYNDAGFAVAIDQCNRTDVLDELIAARFSERDVRRIVLVPSLETNHRRNLERNGKRFTPDVLTDTIDRLNPEFRQAASETERWLVLSNEEPLNEVLKLVHKNLRSSA